MPYTLQKSASILTFRDGLLTATPATSDVALSARTINGTVEEGKPFSLFFPTIEPCSCLMGLESSGASLLATGVMEMGGYPKGLFASVVVGVFGIGVPSEDAGVGELVDFF